MTRASGRTGDARGFTIIELLFVMTVLGILASIALPRYNRYLIRADAAELSSRVNAIELGVREAEAMDGRLPAPGRAGVVPGDLQRFLTDSLFRAPVGVTISYLMLDGRPFGVDGKIPAALLIGSNGRANEAIDAMATVYPRAVVRNAGAMVVPFEGRLAPAGGVASGSGGPTSPNTQPGTTQPTTTQPTTTQPSQSGSTPSQPVVPQPTTPGGYTRPPTDCFSGALPPGQAKQCASGGGNSAWFRDQNNNNNGHNHNH